MNKLPITWAEISFGELNRFSSQTIDPANFPNESFELYSVPSFPSGKPELLIGSRIGSTKQLVQPNDILVCKINPRINRVWQVSPSRTYRQIASSEWIVMRSPEMDMRFLRYFFTSPVFREQICQDVTGVGGSLTRAQPKRVATICIPVAPFAEQQRIADLLDTVITHVKVVRERLDRLSAVLKRCRISILAAATSGKLTEAWRKEKNIDKAWIKTDVKSVAQVGTGSTPLRSNLSFFADTGTPWITSSASAKPMVLAADEFVTKTAITTHRLKKYPVGTLLVAMYGEGKTRGQVTELGIEATINQACAAIIVDNKSALRGFVKLALQANYLEMRELAEGGNQPNLNLSKIKEFPLRLPPRAEQIEITKRVATLFSLADRIEARLMNTLVHIEQLLPVVLTKAYQGQLLPQAPNDATATGLLECIRVERTLFSNTMKKRTIGVNRQQRTRKVKITMTKSRFDDDVKHKPYLANLIHSSSKPLNAEALFEQSHLSLVDFYKQLAWEVEHGIIKDNAKKLEVV